jgi:hypothetical protein
MVQSPHQRPRWRGVLCVLGVHSERAHPEPLAQSDSLRVQLIFASNTNEAQFECVCIVSSATAGVLRTHCEMKDILPPSTAEDSLLWFLELFKFRFLCSVPVQTRTAGRQRIREDSHWLRTLHRLSVSTDKVSEGKRAQSAGRGIAACTRKQLFASQGGGAQDTASARD